jgi:hypothetical protein
MQISLTFQVNLIFMNCFQVNRATYKIQTTSYYMEEEESGEDLDSGGGGVEKEWERGVDLTAVDEVVGVASRRTQSRSGLTVWTRRWSGRQLTRRRRGLGGGWRGTSVDPTVVEADADVEEERARG